LYLQLSRPDFNAPRLCTRMTAMDRRTVYYRSGQEYFSIHGMCIRCYLSDRRFDRASFKLPDSELTFIVSIDRQRVRGTTLGSLPGGRHSSFVSESQSKINADEFSHRELKFTSIGKGITSKPQPEESNVTVLMPHSTITDCLTRVDR